MVLYEVTAIVPAELAADYERFMREEHIPELLATGCFVDATCSRSEDGRIRNSYTARDQTALDRYLRDHAPRLRAAAAEQFPVGLLLSREVWTVLGQWDARSS